MGTNVPETLGRESAKKLRGKGGVSLLLETLERRTQRGSEVVYDAVLTVP